MPGRIPPGRLEAVAEAAYDDRATVFEQEHPGVPRQGRWGDAHTPERFRVRFRGQVADHDEGNTARINSRTQASIERAIAAEVARGRG